MAQLRFGAVRAWVFWFRLQGLGFGGLGPRVSRLGFGD